MSHKDADEDERTIIGYDINGQPMYRQTAMRWFETQSFEDFFKEEPRSDS